MAEKDKVTTVGSNAKILKLEGEIEMKDQLEEKDLIIPAQSEQMDIENKMPNVESNSNPSDVSKNEETANEENICEEKVQEIEPKVSESGPTAEFFRGPFQNFHWKNFTVYPGVDRLSQILHSEGGQCLPSAPQSAPQAEEKLNEDVSDLGEPEKGSDDDMKAAPEVSIATPQMTSFDLISSSFAPDFKVPSYGPAQFDWKAYPVRSSLLRAHPEAGWGESCVSLGLEFRNPEFRFKVVPAVHYLWHASDGMRFQNRYKSTCRHAFRLFKSDSEWDFRCARPGHKHIDVYNMEVFVEPPAMAQQVYSYDGVLNWSMGHVWQRMALEREDPAIIEHQESPYFYTGPKGYRVQIHLKLNGSKHDKRIKARVCFLTGEFDDQLSGSFPHLTTFTLKAGSCTWETSAQKDIVKERSYVMDLFELKEMMGAVQDDTLTFKFAIEAVKGPV